MVCDRKMRRPVSRRSFLAGAAAIGYRRGRSAHAQDRQPDRGGVVRVGLSQLPRLWDPLGSRDFSTIWLGTLIYDSLFQVDSSGNIVAGLALFVAISIDGQTLTIDLRPDARFADGRPVTATDVVVSLQRAWGRSWRLESVVAIEAVSASTIQIVTGAPDVALPASLASPELAILPADAPPFADAIAAGRLPVGSGPFRPLPLEDDEVKFLPNDWYWQIGRPRLGGFRVVGMTEESMRATALLTGEVDVLPDVPLLDVELCRQGPALTVVGGPSVGGCMLVLNLRQEPMSDTAFRLLLNRAIDREALVQAATANEATPRQAIIPEDHWAALDAPAETSNADSLRQDLRDLGYPVGLRLRMISDERNISLSNAAVFIQEQLAFIGISLTVDLLDPETLTQALADGDYDIYATNIDPWQDPHEVFRPWVMSDGVRNVGGYTSARADRLIRSGVLVASDERRAPIYQQLQQILLREVPFVVLYLQNYFDSMTSVLQNYPAYPPISGLGMRHAWLADQ